MGSPHLDQCVADFERDGFVNGGKVLSDEETAALGEELERYADTLWRGRPHPIKLPPYAADLGHDPTTKPFQISGLWQVSDPFRRLIENPRMLAIAAALARAESLQMWADGLQYKPPHSGGPFHWHQDAPYHLSIRPAERLIGVWISLDDATEESGCMWMVPGSHRWGVQEPHLWTFREAIEPSGFGKIGPPPEGVPASEFRPAVPCPVRAGEVHFHHALTWHGSPTNRSPRPRRAYSFFLAPDGIIVSGHGDRRLRLPEGASLTEAGWEFPMLYRAGRGSH
jgi:hypothetical protein